jgi:hypothetical protein
MLPFLHLRWIGYQGTDLLYFGLMYQIFGLAVILDPQRNPMLFHTHLPVWLRVFIWSGAGVFAVVAAFTHRRWPRMSRIGFAALVFGPAERFTSYATGMIRQPTTVWLAATAFYLLLTLIIMSLSNRPEPAELPAELS